MGLDTKKILETPTKIFRQKYKEMEANYNKESAKKFIDWVKTQTLEVFMDNFIDITKESYYGTELTSFLISNCPMLFMGDYYNMIDMRFYLNRFIADNKSKVPDYQLEQYMDLHETINNEINNNYWSLNTMKLGSNTFSGDGIRSKTYDKIVRDFKISSLYEDKEEDCNIYTEYNKTLISIMNNIVPVVNNGMDVYRDKEGLDFINDAIHGVSKIVILLSNLKLYGGRYDEPFKTYPGLLEAFGCFRDFVNFIDSEHCTYAKNVFLTYLNRIFLDKRIRLNMDMFCEKKRCFYDPITTYVINSLDKRSLVTTIDSMKSVECREAEYIENVIHGSRFNAVNDIMFNALEDARSNEYIEEKEYIESEVMSLYRGDFELLLESYTYDLTFRNCDYPTLDDSISSYKEAFDFLLEKTNYEYFSEDESSSDDAVKKLETSGKHDKPKQSLTKKIQNKAMDAEAKQAQKRAKRKEAAGNIAGAAKAVSNIPKNIVDDIKAIGKKIDDKDDERRKKFMAKPGFRKHIFKTLKLALLYGSAAHCKLSLVPVVALIRHFSKEKDARIWNELQRELDTEIKIAEEKINDANTNGDQKAKYELMRIKEKLEQEKDRVKLNSKYI